MQSHCFIRKGTVSCKKHSGEVKLDRALVPGGDYSGTPAQLSRPGGGVLLSPTKCTQFLSPRSGSHRRKNSAALGLNLKGACGLSRKRPRAWTAGQHTWALTHMGSSLTTPERGHLPGATLPKPAPSTEAKVTSFSLVDSQDCSK